MRAPLAPLSLLIIGLVGGCGQAPGTSAANDDIAPPLIAPRPASPDMGALAEAIRRHSHGAVVEGEGQVVRVLHDDNEGSPHQRFLLRVAAGTTVLVAHNIDLAPRLEGLVEGDVVGFRGEYIWNPKGGLIHWTHGDPQGRHAPGWLRYRGRLYR